MTALAPDYVSAQVRLYCGDCRVIVDDLQDVDAMIMDPPYGISLSNNDVDGHRREADYVLEGDEDQATGMSMLWLAGQHLWPVVVFASPWKPWPGEWRNLIVWDKGGAVGGGGDIKTCLKRTWELIQVARNGPLNGQRDSSVWYFPVTPQESKHHICAKPVNLMIALVNQFTTAGQTVIDPFMGSGTTGIACLRTGRKFIGIEKDPAHFATALERIKREESQGKLF